MQLFLSCISISIFEILHIKITHAIKVKHSYSQLDMLPNCLAFVSLKSDVYWKL